LLPQGALLTGREGNGSSLTWTEPDKLPENLRCRRRTACLLHIVDLIRSRPQAIKDDSMGEEVRTRTVLLQAHTHQFLGACGAAGNED
jgi:hypothetical protein